MNRRSSVMGWGWFAIACAVAVFACGLWLAFTRSLLFLVLAPIFALVIGLAALPYFLTCKWMDENGGWNPDGTKR